MDVRGGARTFARPEPLWRVGARALLLTAGLFAGPTAGLVAHRLLEQAGAPDPGRWSLGTGLGLVAGAFALGALWERGARRRYGWARLFAEGASFDRRGEEPRQLAYRELELDEVTDHGLLLAPREAGGWSRWWSPLLVPTAGPAESEVLVAELGAWRDADRGPGTLHLRPPAHQLLALLLVAPLPLVGPAAMISVDAWSWVGLVLWLCGLVDLWLWAAPLGAGVGLLPGALALGEQRWPLARLDLALAGRWLQARGRDRGELLGTARPSQAGARLLRERLCDALAVVDGATFARARRRLLLRALALVALGGLSLAAALRSGLP